MKKSAILIGLSIGLLLSLLQIMDYFHLIRLLSFDYYAAGVGLIFFVSRRLGRDPMDGLTNP